MAKLTKTQTLLLELAWGSIQNVNDANRESAAYVRQGRPELACFLDSSAAGIADQVHNLIDASRLEREYDNVSAQLAVSVKRMTLKQIKAALSPFMS